MKAAAFALALVTWGSDSDKVPLFGKIDEDNADVYYDSGSETKEMVWISFHPDKVEEDAGLHHDAISRVAADHEEKQFVYYDTKKFDEHATAGLGCAEYPCVSLVQLDDDDQEVVFTRHLPAFHEDAVRSFLEDTKNGQVDPYTPPADLEDLEDEEDMDLEDDADFDDMDIENLGTNEGAEM